MAPEGADWRVGLRRDAAAVLTSWTPSDDADRARRNDFLDFLAEHHDAVSRDCLAGHLTASALIVNPDATEALLTLHPKVGLWIQTGGHCEPADVSLRDAALREAREESGIADLRLSSYPVQLDRHTINCRPGVVLDHLDVQYVAIAPPNATTSITDESLDLRWFASGAPPQECDASTRALMARARSLVEKGEFA